MTHADLPRVRALSIHADYRCRHAGVCCSSGWAIPVEPGLEERLRAVPAGGLRDVSGLPHGARVVLATKPTGECVFLGAGPGGRCAVHRQLGEDALPSPCRHFPRVVSLTPLGVSVTLSHYCPTAAAMPFRGDVPLAVVSDPPAFPASWPWEGLDARDALPPLLRPGVLMDWPSLERWERFCVSVLAREASAPEAALDVLEDAAEAARRWRPQDGAFGEFFEAVIDRSLEEGEGRPAFPGALRSGIRYARDPGVRGSRAWSLVLATVPHRESLPTTPATTDEADERWVRPAWPALGRPVRRWLAAKAFASWVALQGEGLRTAALGLRVALGVLRAEAARGCAAIGRPLDADLLKEAFRRTDLLLVHLADPEVLARRLSACESGGKAGLDPGVGP